MCPSSVILFPFFKHGRFSSSSIFEKGTRRAKRQRLSTFPPTSHECRYFCSSFFFFFFTSGLIYFPLKTSYQSFLILPLLTPSRMRFAMRWKAIPIASMSLRRKWTKLHRAQNQYDWTHKGWRIALSAWKSSKSVASVKNYFCRDNSMSLLVGMPSMPIVSLLR